MRVCAPKARWRPVGRFRATKSVSDRANAAGVCRAAAFAPRQELATGGREQTTKKVVVIGSPLVKAPRHGGEVKTDCSRASRSCQTDDVEFDILHKVRQCARGDQSTGRRREGRRENNVSRGGRNRRRDQERLVVATTLGRRDARSLGVIPRQQAQAETMAPKTDPSAPDSRSTLSQPAEPIVAATIRNRTPGIRITPARGSQPACLRGHKSDRPRRSSLEQGNH